MGTIAFGSLILAIIYLIKETIEQMKKAAEKDNNPQNQAVSFLLSCMLCCVECLEKIMEYLTKHAYIECALHGSNFCKAAKDSFVIIKSNFFNIGILHGITGITTFFGNLFIASLVTLLGWFMLKSVKIFSGLVIETSAPLIVNNH